MKLILMRHAHCEGLDKSIINGWNDYPLTYFGREEIKEAAEEVIKLIGRVDIDVAYSSWLSRTYETANILLKNLDIKLDVKRDLRLNERHYGKFQGMVRDEARKCSEYNTLSDSADRLDNRLIGIDDKAYEELLEEYEAKLGMKKEDLISIVPKSESIIDIENRVKDFLETKIFIQENKDKTILIVSHANPIKIMVKYIENLTFEETTKLRFSTCGTKIYDMDRRNNEYVIVNNYNINKEWKE